MLLGLGKLKPGNDNPKTAEFYRSRKGKGVFTGVVTTLIGIMAVTYGILKICGVDIDGWISHLENLPRR
jgi:predicted HAD superfamily Cof-like phosphohydrolase